jgi:hypothetical protein
LNKNARTIALSNFLLPIPSLDHVSGVATKVQKVYSNVHGIMERGARAHRLDAVVARV